MATQLFVNLITDNLPAARTFYEALGWTINPQFSDENAISVVISPENYLMVLRRDFYEGFLEGTGKTTTDSHKVAQVLIAFSLDSKQEVDDFIAKARVAGAKIGKTQDLGFMYQSQFDDLDGNHFEPFYMDPATVE